MIHASDCKKHCSNFFFQTKCMAIAELRISCGNGMHMQELTKGVVNACGLHISHLLWFSYCTRAM